MKRYNEQDHNRFLDRLVNHLSEVGEDPKRIRWIMKDGIFLHEDSCMQRKLCDIIAVYDDFAVPLELKGSWKKQSYAKKQLRSGVHFINEELGLVAPYGTVVVYTPTRYEHKQFVFNDIPSNQ